MVRRPSCLSVCPSVNFLRKSLLLRDKWLDCDQTCRRWSPGKRASRVCSRSRSRGTWHMIHKNRFFFHANGCILTKFVTSLPFVRFLPLPNPQMAVSTAIAHNSHTGSDTACQPFVKLFAIHHGLTFCLFMRSLYDTSLGPTLSFHYGCALRCVASDSQR